MRFSLLQKIPNYMYRYDSSVQTSQPNLYSAESFISPKGFDPVNEEVNIAKIFNDYYNPDKKFIFSVGHSTISTLIQDSPGRTYIYSENDSNYITISSGNINWTPGSIKRYVIIIESGISLFYTAYSTFEGMEWLYCGHNAFISVCESQTLKYIHLEHLENLLSIGAWSFFNCYNLTGIVTIPDTITEIGDNAFGKCVLLTDVILPLGLRTIGEGAFSYCTGLQTIKLNDGLISIGFQAFLSVGINSNNFYLPSTLTSIGQWAFGYCKMTGIIEIPFGITTMGGAAFCECSNISYLKLPSSILSLPDDPGGYGMFRYCNSLARIDCKANTPPTLGSQAFYNINRTTCIIHVLVGSLEAYQADSQWGSFTNIIEDL